MKGDKIKGRAVVSITDAAKLGRVDDVLVDTEERRVAALHVKARGEEAVIPFDQVCSVGSDAVTVPSPDVVQRASTPSEADSLVSMDDLSKLKVVDEAGTFLGTVSDVVVDRDDGQITEIQTQKGGVFGVGGTTHTVAPEEITSIGDEVMVVQAPEPVSGRRDAAAKPADHVRTGQEVTLDPEDVVVLAPRRRRPGGKRTHAG